MTGPRPTATTWPRPMWARPYPEGALRRDVLAGLTTAVMLVPQGMAYAMLAGLPPIVGLYASLVPLAVYALLGTSRELAVGPVAMISLLTAQALAPHVEAGHSALALALLLAGLVGAIQLAMGLLRFGAVVNLLSHPVLSGFTSAAAILIGVSQLPALFGVEAARGSLATTLATVGGAAWHLPTLAIGLAAAAVLVAAKRWWPAFPRALAVVVLGTVAVVVLGTETLGVRVVGEVPSGLPAPALPPLDGELVRALAPSALLIALVGFMESISVAKAFARKARYELDPDRELVALGAANLAGAFFGAYPVTGGFSRTAVNAQAGARTPLAGLVTAALVGVTLVALTPLFESLPRAVLSAIVLTAVAGLVDLTEVRTLWRVARGELVLLVLTFVGTLALGIEEGIALGVAASILAFVWRSTRPHVAVLGRLPGTQVYRNVERFPEAEVTPGVLAVRIDAQLYFGNATFLRRVLRELEAAHRAEHETPLRCVVLDASGVNELDTSAQAALSDVVRDYRERDVQIVLAMVKGPVRDVLEITGTAEQLSHPDLMPLSVHHAMGRVAPALS